MIVFKFEFGQLPQYLIGDIFTFIDVTISSIMFLILFLFYNLILTLVNLIPEGKYIYTKKIVIKLEM